MAKSSQYPGFHKYINRAFLAIICALAIILPILYITTKQPSLKNTIAIVVCVIISYIVYWLIVRLNCYGTPGRDSESNTPNNNNNSVRNTSRMFNRSPRLPPQSPRSDSSTSSRSSSNGGSSNANNNHPTFASYRLGGLAEIFRRFGSNNGGASNTNDDGISDVGETLRPPPPTYNIALEGAGLPPPYMNDSVGINIHNSESPQMSETPRRPVPSVPSSSSLRRPVPPIPQQQSSSQSTQDPTSSIISDSSSRGFVPSTPRRLIPSIPSSSSDNSLQPPKRSVPPVPASSSTLPPRLHKSISHDSSINNRK